MTAEWYREHYCIECEGSGSMFVGHFIGSEYVREPEDCPYCNGKGYEGGRK